MRGWAAVAWLAGIAAAVTVLLLWWRWRQFGAAWRGSSGAGRHRRGKPGTWLLLLSGLALVFNGVRLVVRHPPGDGFVVGVVVAVAGAVISTVVVGGLLAERR